MNWALLISSGTSERYEGYKQWILGYYWINIQEKVCWNYFFTK